MEVLYSPLGGGVCMDQCTQLWEAVTPLVSVHIIIVVQEVGFPTQRDNKTSAHASFKYIYFLHHQIFQTKLILMFYPTLTLLRIDVHKEMTKTQSENSKGKISNLVWWHNKYMNLQSEVGAELWEAVWVWFIYLVPRAVSVFGTKYMGYAAVTEILISCLFTARNNLDFFKICCSMYF